MVVLLRFFRDDPRQPLVSFQLPRRQLLKQRQVADVIVGAVVLQR